MKPRDDPSNPKDPLPKGSYDPIVPDDFVEASLGRRLRRPASKRTNRKFNNKKHKTPIFKLTRRQRQRREALQNYPDDSLREELRVREIMRSSERRREINANIAKGFAALVASCIAAGHPRTKTADRGSGLVPHRSIPGWYRCVRCRSRVGAKQARLLMVRIDAHTGKPVVIS